MLTVPQYFVADSGQNRCFFCGGSAGDKYPTSKHVKDTFTAYDTVAMPGSSWVCAGCVEVMRSDATVKLPDGSTRVGKPWQWSWCVKPSGPIGYACCFFLGGEMVKSHAPLVRRLCLEPPELPFALVLAVAGRVHQLYRATMNHSRETVSLLMDGENIIYAVDDLAARVKLTTMLVSSVGKPAMEEPFGPPQWMNVMERFSARGEDMIGEWNRVRTEPLSRLALYLTPNKEESQRESPSTAQAD